MRERPRESSADGRRIGAVDIGGSKIAVGIVCDDGQILGRSECATLPEKGFADAMERIDWMLSELGARRDGLVGIGVGCPGPLDPRSGRLLDVGTLPGWNGSELAAELRYRFGVDVAVENDADAAALGEFAWGGGVKSSRFIYVTVSTGIGGGIVLDGTLYRGNNHAHPELGHQVLDASGPSCYCGGKRMLGEFSERACDECLDEGELSRADTSECRCDLRARFAG